MSVLDFGFPSLSSTSPIRQIYCLKLQRAQRMQIDPPTVIMNPWQCSTVVQRIMVLNGKEESIQELGRLLLDKDRQLVKESAFRIYSLAKFPDYVQLLVKNPKVIEAIVCAMIVGRESRDHNLLKSTLGTLYLISGTPESPQPDGLKAILCSGAIPHLVAFLSGDFDSALYNAISIIHNLLAYHPNSRDTIQSADPVPLLVRLLKRDNDRFLTFVVDSLRILAKIYPGTRLLLIPKHKAHIPLIRILNNSNYEKLLGTTSRLIRMLCDIQHNDRVVIQSGGILALTKHLAHESHRLVLICLKALRSLSHAAIFVNDLGRLFDGLIHYLGVIDQEELNLCLDILYNLTCKNSNNKKCVCDKMGLEALIRVWNEHFSRPSIATKVMLSLKNLIGCSKTIVQNAWGTEVQTARDKLRQLGCIPLISRYLDLQQFLQHSGLTFLALELLRNLAMSSGSSWEEFRQYHIVEAVANLSCEVRARLYNMGNWLSIDHLKALYHAFRALSFLCQCGENRRILSEHTDLENMANEVISNPSLDASLKESASDFLAALHAPPQIEVAPLVGMNNGPIGDMDAVVIEANIQD